MHITFMARIALEQGHRLFLDGEVEILYIDAQTNRAVTSDAEGFKHTFVFHEPDRECGDTEAKALTPESMAVIHLAYSLHAVNTDTRLLKPHADLMREAFPELTYYRIRDHRLLHQNNVAVLACYRGYKEDGSDLEILGGFGLGPDRRVEYAEVESWRYQVLPAETFAS